MLEHFIETNQSILLLDLKILRLLTVVLELVTIYRKRIHLVYLVQISMVFIIRVSGMMMVLPLTTKLMVEQLL